MVEVLALMRRYFQNQLKEATGMLDELEKPVETTG